MRLLCTLLVTLLITGCVNKGVSGSKSVPADNQPPAAGKNSTTHTPAVRLFSDTTELASLPFHDLGLVYGDDCQASMQDPLPSIPVARKKMLSRAAHKNANAVLLHQCEMMNNSQGCYRQAICQGSALQVSLP